MRKQNSNRKTRKVYGGVQETTYRMYANQIKNKEHINVEEFERFLDSVKNPLSHAYKFDNDDNEYTINEYAILHGYALHEFDIHAKFRKYDVNLRHTAVYPNFNIPEPLNIIEAYIYDGKYLENIRLIMVQIQKENLYSIYFRNLRVSKGLPSVLYFVLEASNFLNDALNPHIYHAVTNIYMHPTVYDTYLIQNNPQNVLNLLSIAIQYNKPFLLREICGKMQNAETVYSYIFTQKIVSYLLLQNNNELFKTTFGLLQSINPSKVLEYINKYAIDPNKDASKILQKYKDNQNYPTPRECKRFFEILGLHILQDVLPPYIGDTVRIIIRCHGTMLSNVPEKIAYPFNRLCYFVEKGKYLIETCYVSNRIENMVCNGNYDNSLKCISSIDGQIETEPMRFSFNAGFYKGIKHSYTGIYVCRNASVERADEYSIDNDKKYAFPEMIDIVKSICDYRQIGYNNVDIMIFACRAYVTDTNPENSIIHPKITASENSR